MKSGCFEYFPECVDEEGDNWEEFWQVITTTKTITDTEAECSKTCNRGTSLIEVTGSNNEKRDGASVAFYHAHI